MKKILLSVLFNGDTLLPRLVRYMKLIFILTFVCSIQVSANVFSQTRFTLDMKNVSVDRVLSQIQKQSDYRFFYNYGHLKHLDKVNIQVKDMPVAEILDRLLDNSLSYRLLPDELVVIAPKGVQTDDYKLDGVVTDDQGQPLSGVSIQVKGSATGATTDESGKFWIVVPRSAVLVVSYIGFQTQEIPVDGRPTLRVQLQVAVSGLNEVVVTALGITREKRAIGYAVQSIKGEEISTSASPNLVQALSGKAAGLFITGGTTGLGGSSNIIVRGNTNLSGNNLPLFVIDGIPFFNDEVDKQSFWDSRNIQGSVDFGDPISKLNTGDIEEVTILKGAGATALYGSRAANGVILITTKKGRGLRKGVGITYTNNTTFSNPVIRSDFQQEYGAGHGGQYSYTGDRNNPGVNEFTQYSWGPKFDKDLYIPQFRSPRADGTIVSIPWIAHPHNVNDFLRTGILGSHNLAASFGGDFGHGRISINKSNESGMVPETDEEKLSANANLVANLSKKWKAELMINYVEAESDGRVPGWGTGITQNLMRMPSNFDMKYINSIPHKRPDGSQVVFTGFDNPYWTLFEDFNSYKRRNIIGNVGLRYAVTDWLEAKVSASKTLNNGEYRNFTQMDLTRTTSGDFFNDGAYGISTDTHTENNYDILLFGKRNLSADLDFSFSAGANRRETYSVNWNANVQQLASPDLANLNNGLGTKVVNQNYSQKQTQSVFGLFSFGYKDYLYLDLTGRNDWSSTLPKQNRSYFYPSSSLSFLFTEALEMNSSILNYGKLRFSWAQVGSDTAPYQLAGTFNAGVLWDGLQTNSYTATLPPANLKPQRTNSLEAGAELNFFNNRLNLDLSYYKTNTTDQIVTVNIPYLSGSTYATINAGNLQNEGVELMLNANPIKSKNFNWLVAVNASKNVNRMVKLHPDIKFIRTGWGSMEVRVTEGGKYGEIYGFSYVKNPEGHNIIMDNGMPYRSEDYPDMDWDQYLGSAQPDWLGGITNTFIYKSFSLSSTINARFGGLVFSMSNQENMRQGLLKETIGLNDKGIEKRLPVSQGGGMRAPGVKEVKDESGHVTGYEENDVYVEASAYYDWKANIHEDHLFDASYIKWRDLSLSYRVPAKLLNYVKYLQELRVSLVAYNLAVIKSHIPNLDPEVSLGRNNAGHGMESGALPAVRTIGFQVNVTF